MGKTSYKECVFILLAFIFSCLLSYLIQAEIAHKANYLKPFKVHFTFQFIFSFK